MGPHNRRFHNTRLNRRPHRLVLRPGQSLPSSPPLTPSNRQLTSTVLAHNPHPNLPHHGPHVVTRTQVLQRLRLRHPGLWVHHSLALRLGRRNLLRHIRKRQRHQYLVNRVRQLRIRLRDEMPTLRGDDHLRRTDHAAIHPNIVRQLQGRDGV